MRIALPALLCAAVSLAVGVANVHVQRAVKVNIAKGTPALSVDYSYTFAGVTAVRLRNVGIVPPSGHLHYITTDEALVFEDVATGALLAHQPLHETIIVATQPPLIDIPRDTDFPASFRAYRWHSHASLLERAYAVLNTRFHYRPFERDGRSYVVTDFAQIPDLPSGTRARVALLLSFPYDRVADSYDFHVQSLVREAPSHSDDYRPTGSPEGNPAVIGAADAFVNRMVVMEIER